MKYEDLQYLIWMENQEKKEKCIYAGTCGSADCVSCGDYTENDSDK